MQDGLIRRTAVFSLLFTLAAMSAMLYFAANKIIVVADVAQDEVVQSAQTNEVEMTGENAVLMEPGGSAEYFCIPLPKTVKPEEVTVENHYMDQELWVSIRPQERGGLKGFYEQNAATGNQEQVLDGHFEEDEAQITLRFKLTGLYEYQSVFRDNMLYMQFLSPKEVYDKIVVVDAAYGGKDYGARDGNFMAKNVTLDIARALKEKMDDTDIKVYYTRMDDSDLQEMDRVQLAGLAEADMLIRIEVGVSDDPDQYGTETVCNSRYFIPDFGSVELADILERQVVTAISGKAAGLTQAQETDEVVREATVPAAAVRVGYFTNAKEEALLQREDYRKRIAEGIYQAILSAYEKTGDKAEGDGK